MDSASPVADAAARVLRDVCDPQTVNSAKDDGWKGEAWEALEQAGLTLAWVPEELGGAGTGLADGFAVLRQAGRFAVAVPLAETLLAGWLLSRAGIKAPSGAMTCAPMRPGEELALERGGTVSGHLRAVALAKEARHIALLCKGSDGRSHVALVEASAAAIADGKSIAGDALNAITLKAARPLAVEEASGLDAEALMLMGAAVRAVQMAGALEAILDTTTRYANERIAFERPIAKFQAVQQNLARLAGEVAAAIAASGSAADAIATASPPHKREGNFATVGFDEGVFLEAASAKIRVGEAGNEGAAIAHQVMGAIGFTMEHTLHRFTRRLWAWRDDFGNESYWAVRLGNVVAAKGADGLWPMLAAR